MSVTLHSMSALLVRGKIETEFEVVMAASMKAAVFRVVMPYSVVELNFYQTTRRYPEDSHLLFK
jgi:hypothetical protein